MRTSSSPWVGGPPANGRGRSLRLEAGARRGRTVPWLVSTSAHDRTKRHLFSRPTNVRPHYPGRHKRSRTRVCLPWADLFSPVGATIERDAKTNIKSNPSTDETAPASADVALSS